MHTLLPVTLTSFPLFRALTLPCSDGTGDPIDLKPRGAVSRLSRFEIRKHAIKIEAEGHRRGLNGRPFRLSKPLLAEKPFFNPRVALSSPFLVAEDLRHERLVESAFCFVTDLERGFHDHRGKFTPQSKSLAEAMNSGALIALEEFTRESPSGWDGQTRGWLETGMGILSKAALKDSDVAPSSVQEHAAYSLGYYVGYILLLKRLFWEEADFAASSKKSAHRTDVLNLIELRGWVKGFLTYLKSGEESDPVLKEAVDILSNDSGSIMNRALMLGDSVYPQRAIEWLVQGRQGNPLRLFMGSIQSLQEAGRVKAALALSKNRKSVFHKALRSGDFEYPSRAAAWLAQEGDANPFHVFERALAELNTSDRGDMAQVLAKNEGTVFAKALSSGDLEYPQKIVDWVLDGEPFKTIGEAVDHWDKSGQSNLAAFLSQNLKSVFSRALSSGDLEYPRKVVDWLTGDASPIILFREAAEDLKESDRLAVFSVLYSNQRSILNRSLSQGDFNYPKKVVDWLTPEEGRDPVSLFEAEAMDLEAQGQEESSSLLMRNWSIIFAQALSKGDLGYPQKAVKWLSPKNVAHPLTLLGRLHEQLRLEHPLVAAVIEEMKLRVVARCLQLYQLHAIEGFIEELEKMTAIKASDEQSQPWVRGLISSVSKDIPGLSDLVQRSVHYARLKYRLLKSIKVYGLPPEERYVMSQARSYFSKLAGQTGSETGTQENVLELDESLQLRDAVRMLDDTEQSLIRMVYYEDSTLEDAAERLGIKLDLAEVRLKSALNKLKRIL